MFSRKKTTDKRSQSTGKGQALMQQVSFFFTTDIKILLNFRYYLYMATKKTPFG